MRSTRNDNVVGARAPGSRRLIQDPTEHRTNGLSKGLVDSGVFHQGFNQCSPDVLSIVCLH